MQICDGFKLTTLRTSLCPEPLQAFKIYFFLLGKTRIGRHPNPEPDTSENPSLAVDGIL